MRDREKTERGVSSSLSGRTGSRGFLFGFIFFFWKKLRGVFQFFCREELVLGDFHLVF